jgi:hypothetical protein
VHRHPGRATFAVLLLAAALAGTPADADHVAGRCETGIPSEEAPGAVWFPRGELFCPLLADPKGDASFASYVRGTSTSAFGTDIASVGIADRLGLFRYNAPSVGEGIQLSLSGSIYAQFDLNAPSYDLINADYLIGLPLTLRRGAFSSRIRLYHQSSHLGDEFILRGPVVRENLAFQAVEALVSADWRALRVYAGGEQSFGAQPQEVQSLLAHGGMEVRQPGLLPIGVLKQAGFIAALDVKSVETLDWSVAWSARAGFEIGGRTGMEHRSKPWRVVGEYYDGPSPYGQFFRDNVTYYGLGIHLGL